MLREKLRKYLPKLPGDVLKIFVILLFVLLYLKEIKCQLNILHTFRKPV